MKLERKLEKRNVLITGGSHGIGRAIARRFAEEGANLILCARGAGSLQDAAAELQKSVGKVAVHVTDVSDQKSVEELGQYVLNEFGYVDVLVNSAGIYIPNRFLDYSHEEFDQVMKVNLYGVFQVTKAILPKMIERKAGKIINIASTAGKWGSRNQSAYNASKHAVIGLTRCLALEMAPFNINVNAICPALVDETGALEPVLDFCSRSLGISKEDARKDAISRIPIGRLIKPEEIASLALYLASNESDGMTAQSISICGGYIMV